MASVNRSQFAILGFLTWGPMSGYDIKKLVEGSVGNFWSESYGQIYPMLRRLAAEGLVERQAPAPGRQAGGRERVAYAITHAGRDALQSWLKEDVEAGPKRNELLLKLFFGRRSSPPTNRAHLEAFRAQKEDDLARYARIEADLRERASRSEDLDYWLMTLRYGELEARAHLRWCDEALATLEARRRRRGGRG